MVDGDRPSERPHALLERLDRPPPPLTGSVVANRQLELLGGAGLHAHGERLRGPPPDRALEGLANDLVQRRLRTLAEHFRGADIELGLDAVLEAAVLRERLHRHREPVVPQYDRLEIEREVAELADRRARARERLVEDLLRLLVTAPRDEIRDRVEHQRDAGKRLYGPVVQKEGDAASFVLLCREYLFGQLAAPGSSGVSATNR